MILSDGEKQLILWTKGYFEGKFKYVAENINEDGCWNREILKELLAYDLNIHFDEIRFADMFIFVKSVFKKLKESNNIIFENSRQFFLKLYSTKIGEQLDIYLSAISSSVFEKDYDLGKPNLSIYEKIEGNFKD